MELKKVEKGLNKLKRGSLELTKHGHYGRFDIHQQFYLIVCAFCNWSRFGDAYKGLIISHLREFVNLLEKKK